MPIIGLGVWRMEGKDIKDLLINAIKIGYRHFDCAADYQNETEVGEALAEAFKTGLVKREDLFITTKLWNSDHGHVVEACKASLKKLQLDYLDLFLIHFPIATKHTGIGKTASALDADGVLEIDTTISLETTWHAMEETVSMGLKHGIAITAHTPLGGSVANTECFGSVSCLDDPEFKALAEKYKKTVAQVVLRWGIQRNTIIIPKSSKQERLEEN
nr:NADP-dependent D-sorbitol-6-phosphate dehydrogenase [Tanacetum cinerariifolium]